MSPSTGDPAGTHQLTANVVGSNVRVWSCFQLCDCELTSIIWGLTGFVISQAHFFQSLVLIPFNFLGDNKIYCHIILRGLLSLSSFSWEEVFS